MHNIDLIWALINTFFKVYKYKIYLSVFIIHYLNYHSSINDIYSLEKFNSNKLIIKTNLRIIELNLNYYEPFYKYITILYNFTRQLLFIYYLFRILKINTDVNDSITKEPLAIFSFKKNSIDLYVCTTDRVSSKSFSRCISYIHIWEIYCHFGIISFIYSFLLTRNTRVGDLLIGSDIIIWILFLVKIKFLFNFQNFWFV